jgi:pSer/pThr/pTyr-binding forkhead associated (FHA) protein
VSTPSTYPKVPPLYRLRVVEGPHVGTMCRLTSARATVGRSPHNQIALPREPWLSMSHFALNWSPEQRTYVAIDFGAQLTVLINGEPLAGNRSLASGDVLTIGSTQLVFERDAEELSRN